MVDLTLCGFFPVIDCSDNPQDSPSNCLDKDWQYNHWQWLHKFPYTRALHGELCAASNCECLARWFQASIQCFVLNFFLTLLCLCLLSASILPPVSVQRAEVIRFKGWQRSLPKMWEGGEQQTTEERLRKTSSFKFMKPKLKREKGKKKAACFPSCCRCMRWLTDGLEGQCNWV